MPVDDGRTFCAEEFSRDVQSFTSNEDNLLTIEQLLCDSAGQSPQEVSLAIDDHL